MHDLIETIFSISNDIRYVAVYCNDKLDSSVKPGLKGASDSESDKYEELIVNPTILTLVNQRGKIDCGGTRYVLIRYGNFFQFITPIQNGHISVCIEKNADPLKIAKPILEVLRPYNKINSDI